MAESRQVALIRGINVGKAKRIAMADLRAVLEGFGYTHVQTLLNSGNAVYTSPKDAPDAAARRLEKALVSKIGVPARVVALTALEVAAILKGNTLRARMTDPSRFLVVVPLERGGLAGLKPLLAQDWKKDALAVGKHAAYLDCQTGILDSPLVKAVNKALQNSLTARNWATMLKLNELLAADA